MRVAKSEARSEAEEALDRVTVRGHEERPPRATAARSWGSDLASGLRLASAQHGDSWVASGSTPQSRWTRSARSEAIVEACGEAT